ncbi:MAG: RNA polymerase sigma-70 factor [Bacteroidales bacterium]|nr:RNA polymerase sigma-70 factor [Bacteroidales bacterium]
MSNLLDKNLFALISKKRDAAAFDKLFLRWYAPLVSYARQFVCTEDAENVVQDVMVSIWENAPETVIRTSVSSYLFSAVKNRCFTLVNRGSIRMRVMDNVRASLLNEVIPDSSGDLDFNELIIKVRMTLLKLPEPQRRAFEMSRFEDLSYKEIAEIQGVSAKTIEYRISSVLKALREALEDYITS